MDSECDQRSFVYWVDSDDVIVFVNEDWVAFAQENHLDRNMDLVIGNRIWDFITTWETRYVYEIVLDRVRRGLMPVVLPFRCDAPDRRRFMELEISPEAGGKLLKFCGRVVREEARDPVRLFSHEVERSERFLPVCSWCKKVQVSNSEWLEVEQAVPRLDLFGTAPVPQISHAMCPACKAQFAESFGMAVGNNRRPEGRR